MSNNARTVIAYLCAIIGPLAIAVVFSRVFPVLLQKAMFMPFLLLILAIASWRGLLAGLLASVWSGLIVISEVLPAGLRLDMDRAEDRLILVSFVLLSASICWVCENLARKSARVGHEALLREVAEDAVRYRTALLAGRMGSWETDFVTGTRTWSEAGMALFGLDLPNRMGRVGGPDDEWVAAVHPEDRHLLPGIIEQGYELDSFPAEYRIQRANGEVAWLSGRGLVMSRDGNGRPLRYVNIMADITDRIKAEEALKAADKRKDEFLAVLAHELRNPMAPIANALNIMKLVSNDQKALANARQVIERQLNQLVRLVDDLLDVSRITQGKLALRKSPVLLAGIVESAVETSRPMIDAHRHVLSVSLPPEEIRMFADPTRLSQVLSNLLNNACKYTNDGGQIFLTAWREDDEVRISVRDTGIGIPKEQLRDIFTMFMQVASAREGTRSGLGIGLTLVKELVELHGGSIEARSEGRGSEFIVRLPVDPISAEQPALPSPATEASTGRRVLVVDDNVDSAESFAQILELQGYQCRIAHDGPEALLVARHFRPEIIFLDIGLPTISGYEVAQQIRQWDTDKSIRIAALTGWGQEDDRRRSREAGFDHHFVKPVDAQELASFLADEAVSR